MRTPLLSLALLLCVSLSALAQSPKKRHINLPNRNVNAPFSDAVLVGDTLYIAGRIGQFKAVLAEAGMTMDDLVTVQVFCSDVSLFDKWNGVYRTYFKKDFPARAFIGSGHLLFDAHFEMQGTAVKGGEAALKKKSPEAEATHGN